MKIKRAIVISVVLLILAALALLVHIGRNNYILAGAPTRDPQELLLLKFGLTLTEESKIEEFTFNRNGGHFDMKIFADDKDLTRMKKQIETYYEELGTPAPMTDTVASTQLENKFPGWGMNTNAIEAIYCRFDTGYDPKAYTTYEALTVITKASNGDYIIYVSY